MNKYLSKYLEDQKSKIILNDEFTDPLNINTIVESANRFKQHLSEGNKILCVSDTDSDGIGTAILFRKFFSDIINYDNVDFMLAYRDKGYGLQRYNIDRAIEIGAKLVITADQGITSKDAVEYATENDIDVIITDHHTVDPKLLPDTPWIVDPMCPGSTFEPREISGTVVLDLFLQQVKEYPNDYFCVEKMLTTISDVMPLNVQYNRDIIKEAFEKIGKQELHFEREYLYSHMDANSIQDKMFEETHISFGLAPMLNATNRLLSADIAIDFVTEEEPSQSQLKYSNLVSINDRRKEMQAAFVARTLTTHMNHIKGKTFVVLTLSYEELDSNSEKKLAGLLAARIMQDQGVPAAVLVLSKETGDYSGSGRSPYGVLDVLKEFEEEYLTHLGGHAAAFGVGIKGERMDSFIYELQKHPEIVRLANEPKEKTNYIPIDMNDINKELYDYMRSYAPFGKDHIQPIFRSKIKIKSTRKFGALKQHLMLIIDKKGPDGYDMAMMVINAPAKYMSARLAGKEWNITYTVSYYQVRKSLSFMVDGIFKIKK